MARGDHDAAGRAQVLHRVGESRSRGVIVGKTNRDTCARQHFGDGFGEIARGKARVVPHQQALADVLMLVRVVGDGIADAAHILEGVIVGDDAAPAIGAEFDFRCHHLYPWSSQPSVFSSQLPLES